MLKRHLLRCISILLASALCAHAQPWSGIVDSSRAINWSNVGMSIPTRNTACSNLSPGATAAQINSAIAACPSGQAVVLAAGTYNLSAGITWASTNNVTLKGAGADQTFIVFTGTVGCNGISTGVCFAGSNSDVGNEQHTANWTAGYAVGATSITVSNSTGIVAGSSLINLDQLDEATDTSTIWNCLATNVCSNGGSGGAARGGNRSQQQEVLVTACSPSCNNAGSTTLTITPGLYAPNWASGQSPGAFWANSYITNSGIENLSMDFAGTGSSNPGVFIMNCYQCWVKGVRSLTAGLAHVRVDECSHCVIRDSYFYENINHASQSYAIDLYTATSDTLVENNIFDKTTDSNPNNNSGGSGNVAAYNYTVQTRYTASNGWFQASDYDHASGQMFWLREGNQATGFTADDVHGTHHFTTLFRNYYVGWQSLCPPGTANNCTQQTIAVHLYAGSRYFNIIGNVLGRSSYHNHYESKSNTGTNGDTSIYTLGWTGNGGTTNGSLNGFCIDQACGSKVAYDTITWSTLMRWGNYDVVTNAIRWCGNSGDTGWSTTCSSTSEVPTGLSLYANAVPGTETLPASFYLSARPSWWNTATSPWPPIGPDVTGGNIANVGGHANNIPAQVCWTTSTGANPISFNANSCYANAESLSFTVQPVNVHTGNTMTSFVVTVRNADGSTDTTSSASVTVTISACGASLGGTVTVSASSGLATFNAATATGNGVNCQLTAAATNIGSGTSNVFNVGPNKLGITVQPSSSYTSGTSITFTVAGQYNDGTTDTSSNNSVTASLNVTTGSGALTGSTTQSLSSGVRAFSLTISGAGTFTINASASGLTSATSNSFTVTGDTLVFTTQPPASTATGSTLSVVAVTVQLPGGSTDTSVTNAVTLVGSGCVITAPNINPSSGIATFTSNVVVSGSGNCVITASALNVTSGNSNTFTITGVPPPTPTTTGGFKRLRVRAH